MVVPTAAVAMVVGGVALTNVGAAISLALIVIGSGMFFIGMILPMLSEFEIGVTSFRGKLRKRDEEVKSSLGPHAEGLLHAAIARAGSEGAGKELFEKAVVDAYMQWSKVRSEGPAGAVREFIAGQAGSGEVAPSTQSEGS